MRKYVDSGEADGYLWELSVDEGAFTLRSVPKFEIGDTARLTGCAWGEIGAKSPIAYARTPQAGEEYAILGHSPLGAYFYAYGERWAVNWTYTADAVLRNGYRMRNGKMWAPCFTAPVRRLESEHLPRLDRLGGDWNQVARDIRDAIAALRAAAS